MALDANNTTSSAARRRPQNLIERNDSHVIVTENDVYETSPLNSPARFVAESGVLYTVPGKAAVRGNGGGGGSARHVTDVAPRDSDPLYSQEQFVYDTPSAAPGGGLATKDGGGVATKHGGGDITAADDIYYLFPRTASYPQSQSTPRNNQYHAKSRHTNIVANRQIRQRRSKR